MSLHPTRHTTLLRHGINVNDSTSQQCRVPSGMKRWKLKASRLIRLDVYHGQGPCLTDGHFCVHGSLSSEPYQLHGHTLYLVFMSPLCRQKWGHIALPLFAQSASVSAVSLSPIHFSPALSCRRSNSRRWPNAGLLLAHRLRRWPNISPVLGSRVVFGATLNVGQRHRRRANINPFFGSKHRARSASMQVPAAWSTD